MRRFGTVLLSALFVITGWVQFAAAKETGTSVPKHIVQLMRENGFKHQTASWTVQSTLKEENGKTTNSESKIWISGDKYRLENKGKNGKLMVVLDDGQEMYMYTPSEHKAYKWGKSMDDTFSGILNSDTVAESARARKTAKKVGAEVVDGHPCDIYTYQQTVTMMQNQVTNDVKEWLWAAEQFPLKTIVNTPKHKAKIMVMDVEIPATETTSVTKDLVLDQPVDAALFTLPADTKVQTMEMPPAMGGGNSEQAKPGAPESGSTGDADAKPKQPPVDVNKMIKGLF